MLKKGKYGDIEIVRKFSQAIYKYRMENNLTREELALKAGVAPRQLANIEQCNSVCKIVSLHKILIVTGIDFNSLL